MIEQMSLRRPFEGAFRETDDYAGHVARGSSAPGIDYALPDGTPVLAVADGTVAASEWSDAGGRHVMVDHGDRLKTLYCHLRAIWRVRGERVKAGEVIGLSGNTGHSTGPHLHFALQANGRYVDPATWFEREAA